METIPQQTIKGLYRIVLYGPESTGKTSLAQGLAAHFKTQWVPEFARVYLQEKWEREHVVCTFCLLYTSPSPRDRTRSRMPSSA